jgi:hypothetical protein
MIPWPFVCAWMATRMDSGWKGARRLEIVRDFFIALCGFAGTCFAVLRAEDEFWIRAICAAVTLSVLAVSAREDVRTGKFYVLPLLACIGFNVPVALMTSGFREVKGPFAVPLWKELLTVAVILTVLRIAKLAIGDCGLYFACYLSFLTLCRENSFLAFFFMLLVSTVLGAFTWVFMVARRGRGSAKKRFPYTAQIAAGCVAAYALCCFFA